MRAALAGVALGGIALPMSAALAAEDGASFYILGQRGPLAGITPPPGFYFQNSLYVYGGSASAGKTFELGGNIAAGLKGNVVLDVPALLWVTPATIFGGSLGFSIAEPVGNINSTVSAIVSGPLGLLHRGASVSDSTAAFGDPVFGALIGWSAGNFHWQISESINVPIGDYHAGALGNIALHRWAGDTTIAATWLDPAVGLDVSGAAGVTFNGENPATDYRTGTEFHVEAAITQHFSKEFFIGPAGYFYDQITGDSGPGASLGGFQGRVAALGGVAGYSFTAGKVPISATLSVYREFDVVNRLEGTSGWLTIAVPLAALR